MSIDFTLTPDQQKLQKIARAFSEDLLLADPRAAYLHIHFAAAGCYAARAERA